MDRASPFLNDGGKKMSDKEALLRRMQAITRRNANEERERAAQERMRHELRDQADRRAVERAEARGIEAPPHPPLSAQDLRAGEGVEHPEIEPIRDKDGRIIGHQQKEA